jgi:hypothetical protein
MIPLLQLPWLASLYSLNPSSYNQDHKPSATDATLLTHANALFFTTVLIIVFGIGLGSPGCWGQIMSKLSWSDDWMMYLSTSWCSVDVVESRQLAACSRSIDEDVIVVLLVEDRDVAVLAVVDDDGDKE